MSFRVRLHKSVDRKIIRWRLPLEVYVEVRLRLDDLERRPAEVLHRVVEPYDGLVYVFPAEDRSNRAYGYIFTFHVRYGADEQTLWIVSGGYERVPI